MLIGLHGRAQSGKDTCYERLALMKEARRLSIADRLYEVAGYSVAVEPDVLRIMKTDPGALLTVEATFPEGHELAGEKYIYSQITIRNYLQLVGVEGHRKVFGQDFWIKAVDLTHSQHELACVTDVRFADEADAIRESGGFIVRVVGPPSVEDVEDGHSTEVMLEDHEVDFIIDNSVRDDDFAALDKHLRTMTEDLADEWISYREL